MTSVAFRLTSAPVLLTRPTVPSLRFGCVRLQKKITSIIIAVIYSGSTKDHRSSFVADLGIWHLDRGITSQPEPMVAHLSTVGKFFFSSRLAEIRKGELLSTFRCPDWKGPTWKWGLTIVHSIVLPLVSG